MLRRLGTPFKCRLLPAAIVEVFCAHDPLTVEFRHDVNQGVIQLSKNASRAVAMPAELRGASDEAVNEVLRHLMLKAIHEGARERDPARQRVEAYILAGMMLEPVRRAAAGRRAYK